jgi:hypothetical protein
MKLTGYRINYKGKERSIIERCWRVEKKKRRYGKDNNRFEAKLLYDMKSRQVYNSANLRIRSD